MKLFGSITELVSAVFRRSSPSNTIAVQPGTNTASAGNVVVELPPATTGTSVLVDTTTAQAISGKTLTSGDLYAPNVQFRDATDSTKRVSFNLTGMTSGVTTSLVSTNTGNVDISLPAGNTNETIVGRATSDTLTNKDIDGGTASNTRRITLPKGSISNLTALTRKEATILYASDTDKVYVDNGTSLVEVGAGTGTGELNVVANPSGATDTTGWSTSGTTTITRIATGGPLDPLIPSAFRIDGGAASDYVESTWSIPEALRGRKLKLEWYQEPEAGGDTGEWQIEVRDTAGTAEYPLSTDISGTSLVPTRLTGKYTTTFDMDSGTSIRIRFVRVTGINYLDFTNVIVGPGIQPQGAVVTESRTTSSSENLTLSNFTGTSFTSGKVTRVGDYVHIRGRFDATGAATGTLTMNVGSALSVDTAKLSPGHIAGTIHAYDSSASTYYVGDVVWDGTQFNLVGPNTVAWNATVPVTLATGDILSVDVSYPVLQFSGSGTINLATSDTMGSPLVYQYTNWNPSGTGATTTDPSSGSTVATNNDISVSGPSSGTVTFTFSRPGKYAVTCNIGHSHANTYTLARMLFTHGGTATRRGNLSDSGIAIVGIDAGDSDDYSTAFNFIVDVSTVGQTYTFRPQYSSDGISSAAQHTAYGSVVIQPLNFIGQSIGFNNASATYSGLAPAGVFDVSGAVTLQEQSATPADPASGTAARTYMKGDKYVIQFNDAGTVRYKYLDLTGTGVTWVHTTTAP